MVILTTYMSNLTPSLNADVAAIAAISSVPAILNVVSETTGMGLALVARVTRNSWTACAVLDKINFGLAAGDTLDVATTLCSVVRDSLVPVVIDHASIDPVYSEHPTPKMYAFESYIAVPIFRRGGEYFGNLCVLDPRPARPSDPATMQTMRLFADLISRQLDDEEQRERDRSDLSDEKQLGELREQFIAVLGHDLRNPLASIVMGTELLRRRVTGDVEAKTLDRVSRSTQRIVRLVDDMLDFARARLGGGFGIAIQAVDDIDARARHVVEEIASVNPGRKLIFESHGDFSSARCDPERIAQLLSNLVANAIEHGDADGEVLISLGISESAMTIAVANSGEEIPDAVRINLFSPFHRRDPGDRGPSRGLGLGLYIASEIVQAHRGRLLVESDAGRTVFRAEIPV
jgi:signal transduction histidine kinase